MLALLVAGIVFLFLVLGALVFIACVLLPQARQHALSAALWCAIWGPCLVAFIVVAGLGLVADLLLTKAGGLQWSSALPEVLSALGWGYLCFGLLASAAAATVSAWIHQVVIERLTFALFRLYAAGVSAGIGSVLGCSLAWWMMSQSVSGYMRLVFWTACTLTFAASFGAAAYKSARSLRGDAPTSFTWISPAEFEGR